MTIEDIERAAIEAAAILFWQRVRSPTDTRAFHDLSEDAQRGVCLAVQPIIRAYERAMWVDGEPPKDGKAYLCEASGVVVDLQWRADQNAWAHGADYDHGWKPIHFRPMPKRKR